MLVPSNESSRESLKLKQHVPRKWEGRKSGKTWQ